MIQLLLVLSLTFGLSVDANGGRLASDARLVIEAAAQHGVDASLLASVCFVESRFGQPRRRPSRRWCGAILDIPHNEQPAAAAHALARWLAAHHGRERQALMVYAYGRAEGADPLGYVGDVLSTRARLRAALERADAALAVARAP